MLSLSILTSDKSIERATFDAPYVRRIFSSSPRDPRYHMLQHLSPKFQNAPNMDREPRAALVLNRFTRTLAVMFATDSVAHILGVTSAQLANKSFYECIDEGCLGEAMRCIESAKANDSIAYLRFWSRDPRRPEDMPAPPDVEERGSDGSNSPDSEGGVALPSEHGSVHRLSNEPAGSSSDDAQAGPPDSHGARLDQSVSGDSPGLNRSASEVSGHHSSRNSSGTDLQHDAAGAVFDEEASRSSTSSVDAAGHPAARLHHPQHPVELEAVISCTSDGLVVILRRARPIIPATAQAAAEMQQGQGMFVAPWGAYQDMQAQPAAFNAAGVPVPHHVAGHGIVSTGPSIDNVMNSIRDVAVFAWSLVGINGNIAAHGHGTPVGEAMPPGGLPIWEPHPGNNLGNGPNNQAQEMWHPWSGRDQQREQPKQDYPLFRRHRDQFGNYRFDDLAPSATTARASMWQSRQGGPATAHGQFSAYGHGPGEQGGIGFANPATAGHLPVPSMQQFNADADAGGRNFREGGHSPASGTQGDRHMDM